MTPEERLRRLEYFVYIIGGLLVMLLGIVLGSAGAYGLVELDHNETYTFNYTNSTNATVSEDFLCEEANVCVPNSTNVTVNVLPGEVQVVTVDFCTVQASCAASQQTNVTKCVIDRSLETGRTYSFTEGACQVELDIDECSDGDPVIGNFDHVKKLLIAKEGTNISITIDNKTIHIPAEAQSFTYDTEIGVSCPGRPNITMEGDADALLEVCRQFTPFLVNDWIKPTLESCNENARSYVTDIRDCSERCEGIQTELGQCQGEVSSMLSTNDACNTAKEDLRSRINDAEGRATTWFTMAMVFLFGCVLLGLIVGVMVWMKVKEGGEL